ncbi:alpha/beta fold hydrolase [Streptomyces sp. NPDC097610]|uniref:alpha/beta fold hydrolase n=1 Tax=Streptomyces sp. NPDC097610 TaxID=3157227 RepID=UPI00332A50D2
MRRQVLEAGEIDRPAPVLVHGAGRGARMWRRQLGALFDSFHVVAPDLPGFDGGPGPFSLAAAVESATEVARQLRPVHLCGHSLGAIVAARVAVARPRLCRAGSGIAPACRMPDGRRRPSREPACPWFRTPGTWCP